MRGRPHDRRRQVPPLNDPVDLGAEPQDLCAWVVVIAEVSGDLLDAHIMETTGIQHPPRCFGATHSRTDLGHRCKRAADAPLSEHTKQQRRPDKQEVDRVKVEEAEQ